MTTHDPTDYDRPNHDRSGERDEAVARPVIRTLQGWGAWKAGGTTLPGSGLTRFRQRLKTMFLTISLLIVALAVGCIVYLLLAARAARRVVLTWSREKLCELGIALEGDPLGAYTLHGSVHGAELKVHSRVDRAPPGAREDESKKTVCAVELPLAVPDLIVCRTVEVDRVMGPLPAVPRTLTGHADFDKVYSLFVSNTTAGPEVYGAGYRQSGAGGALGWAKPPILDQLNELGLEWMRVRSGACDLTFLPFMPEDTVRAAVASANLSRAQAGATLVPERDGPRAADRDASKPLGIIIAGPFFGLFACGFPGSVLIQGLKLPVLETILFIVGGASLIACVAAWRELGKMKQGVPWSLLPGNTKKARSLRRSS